MRISGLWQLSRVGMLLVPTRSLAHRHHGCFIPRTRIVLVESRYSEISTTTMEYVLFIVMADRRHRGFRALVAHDRAGHVVRAHPGLKAPWILTVRHILRYEPTWSWSWQSMLKTSYNHSSLLRPPFADFIEPVKQ